MVATPERRTHCVRIEARDGTAIRVAIGYPVDLLMSNGQVYQGGLYSTNTAISATTAGGPTVIDVGGVYDADGLTKDEVASGKWDGAWVYSFFTDWAAPVEDEEEDRVYQFGKIREEDDRYVVEMLSLIDLMSQTTGRLITPGCLWVFCDEHIDGEIIATDKSRCKLAAADYTIASEITSVTSNMVFIAAGIEGLFPDDWFGNGEIRFTSGNNAGLSYRYVKAFVGATAQITLNAPFYYPPQVGDEFLMIAGCRKRRDEDCVNKFSNGPRHGGFPDVPQKSSVQKFGDQ
jgi:uncharacterized phage protein (TIGR02218 family)